ncbi:MAG TPA: hypothetical protein PKD52_06675 [Clostridiales bacterium]|nr:hypothetical protein [Clostridiales bacterium]
MKTKSIRGKAGLFAVVAAFLFLLAACSTESSDDVSTKSDTTAKSDESVLVLHLTFLDPEGTLLTGNAVDIAIDDTAYGFLTADANGIVTVENVHTGDSIDVTVYAENGALLAVSRIYVYTDEVSMYTENSDGVLYLYVEEGVGEVKAQMQINEGQIFNCVDLVS